MTSTLRDGCVTIRLAGVVDGARVAGLQSTVAEAIDGSSEVILDVSSVEMVSREAVDILLKAASQLDLAGKTMLVVTATEPIPRATDFRRVLPHLIVTENQQECS